MRHMGHPERREELTGSRSDFRPNVWNEMLHTMLAEREGLEPSTFRVGVGRSTS